MWNGCGPQSHGLMASPILTDTPDPEGHRCTGVRLPKNPHPSAAARSSLQHLSQYCRNNGNVTDSGALFVGTRSAACSGLLWLSSLLLSVSFLFSFTPYPHIHCHIHLVCLFHLPVHMPFPLSVCLFLSLFPPTHPLHTCNLS